ncbi:hypothetical protein [Roseospira goensis]|uniref:Uncharacterized protein n=1 Tax=Roseospira goensis TaxID=391922 RepID=A0A7W6RYL0_9PROT|nr:hypothetical protein [Roseospira goensis]MBB4285648.1 hypothetical protein [Roseospira goensis]
MLVTGRAAASALLSTGTPKPSSAPPGRRAAAHPLVDVVRARDPSRAAALEDGFALGEQAVDQLDAAREAMKEGRKEAARQKVERLKAQLQALHLLATTDPEAAAREAARLARQLASAVRAYVQSGGQAGAVSGAGAGAAPPLTGTDSRAGGSAGSSLADPDAAFAAAARDAMARLKAILEAARAAHADREDGRDPTATDRRDASRRLAGAEATLAGPRFAPASAGPRLSLLV